MPDAHRRRARSPPPRGRGPVQPPLLLRLSSRLPPGVAQGGREPQSTAITKHDTTKVLVRQTTREIHSRRRRFYMNRDRTRRPSSRLVRLLDTWAAMPGETRVMGATGARKESDRADVHHGRAQERSWPRHQPIRVSWLARHGKLGIDRPATQQWMRRSGGPGGGTARRTCEAISLDAPLSIRMD